MAISTQKQAVGIVLKKRQLPKIVSEVKLAIDISGSMQSEYLDGTVQAITDRCLAIALEFDDNGQLEAWVFDSRSSQLPVITEDQHENYVEKKILKNNSISKWGGTNYAPVMQDILSETFTTSATQSASGFIGRLFGKKPTAEAVSTQPQHPAFVIFITDGENSDSSETISVLKESQKHNIYWMMVGVGNCGFSFCRRVADQFDNVGFTHISDLGSMSDEEFYLALLNDEFCEWVKKFAAKAA
jgi:hypothetical protein